MIRLENVWKMSWRHFSKTSWRRFEEVFARLLEHVLKTSSEGKNIIVLIKTSRRHLSLDKWLLGYSSLAKLMFWWSLLMWLRKKIKVRTFKNTINYNKHHEKSIPNFWECSVVGWSLIISLHINFWCSWKCWPFDCNTINLKMKLRIESVQGNCQKQIN